MDPSEGTVLFMVLSIAISSHKFLPITSVGDKIDIAAIPWRETKVLGEEIHSHKIKIVHLGHTWPVFPTRPSEFQKDQGLHTHEARSGDVAKSLVVRPKPFSYYGYSLAVPQFLKKGSIWGRLRCDLTILGGNLHTHWSNNCKLAWWRSSRTSFIMVISQRVVSSKDELPRRHDLCNNNRHRAVPTAN